VNPHTGAKQIRGFGILANMKKGRRSWNDIWPFLCLPVRAFRLSSFFRFVLAKPLPTGNIRSTASPETRLMPHKPLIAVLDFLRKISATEEMHNRADAELLERFVASREVGAFAVLVHRHGPRVLAVCRRLLWDAPSAEDAFQATFMVLVRKATSVRKQGPLANWLYGMAQRVALKARTKAMALRSRQRELTDMPSDQPLDDLTWQELRHVLDEDIGRLPQKYRVPIVLCY
jgi:RNA polymerase sigma factor (sigma-70 family)